MTRIEPLMERNFLEYASYVIVDRAIPDIQDGLKPVQRRILHTLSEVDDGKFHKVANVIGETMKLHPHGDASIGDALVNLANKGLFIEKQGNFGNPITGHSAAAPRYIECRLTELARETLFSPALTVYQSSYDGRRKEPVVLPSKLPVVLLMGTDGIAVGMATRILPHNFGELLRAQIGLLRGQEVRLYPDFLSGGIVDVAEYDDGRGRIRARARIEKLDDKTVVIREIPPTTTTEGLIASIEAAVQKGKIKVGSIDDYTTDKVEIQVGLPRGVYADEVIPQLFAYTDCEVSISSNMVVIHNRRPEDATVSGVLRSLTDRLKSILEAELEHELAGLWDRMHWLTLERIFIENRVYKRIENATTDQKVKEGVLSGLKPHLHALREREVTEEDLARLLDIPIRRISLYDMEKNRNQLEETRRAIKAAEAKLADMNATTIVYLDGLLKKYADRFPRRTEVRSFQAVDARAVARQTIKLGYNADTGFFGSDVKGGELNLTVSEYDRILIISQDGSYRVVGPEEKLLIPGKVLYLDRFDQDKGILLTMVYRSPDKMAFGKKVHIQKFIRDKEYELIKERQGNLDLLLIGEVTGTVKLNFTPAPRQRLKGLEVELQDFPQVGVGAKGKRLAAKRVSRVRLLKEKPSQGRDDGDDCGGDEDNSGKNGGEGGGDEGPQSAGGGGDLSAGRESCAKSGVASSAEPGRAENAPPQTPVSAPSEEGEAAQELAGGHKGEDREQATSGDTDSNPVHSSKGKGQLRLFE